LPFFVIMPLVFFTSLTAPILHNILESTLLPPWMQRMQWSSTGKDHGGIRRVTQKVIL
jgi:hypothetical protein